MKHKLTDLKFGQAVHDMHDGPPDFDKLFGPGVSVVGSLHIPKRDGHQFITQMLEERKGESPEWVKGTHYTNKMLVLVAVVYGAPTVYVFAYSYDGRRLGFIEVAAD
jgi:hypothetical protein